MDGPFAPVPDVAALAHRVAGAHAAPVVLFQHDPFCGTSARAHRALAQLTGTMHLVDVARQHEVSRIVVMRTGVRQGSDQETTMNQQSQPHAVGSPISNEAYNVLSALHSKLEGLEAYRKYAQDGESQLRQQLSGQDNQAVETLVGELERLVRENKLRMGEPGRAG